VVSGAQVRITLANGGTMSTTSNSEGYWQVSGLGSGSIKIQIASPGFKTAQTTVQYDSGRPLRYDSHLHVGETNTTVEVTAAAPMIETTQSQVTNTFSGTNLSTLAGTSGGGSSGRRKDRDEKRAEFFNQNNASANVYDLQKRVAGVLPVRIDVPRAGNSYRFARALVLDEETRVTFSYKTSEKR
jgi:hypothetical protein